MTAGPETDEDLVRRARGGDRGAFGELVRRHQTVALRLAAAVTGSTEEARDIVQDAFVQGYRSLDRFRGEAPVRSWLLRIVANHAKNALRSRARRRGREGRFALLDRAPTDADPVGQPVVDRAEVSGLLGMLAALPEHDREVLALRFVAGLSEADTASTLGVPVGTVKSRASRALVHARELLEVREDASG